MGARDRWVKELALNHELWHDPVNFSAAEKDGIRERSHQSNRRAAVYESDSAVGHRASKVPGSFEVAWMGSGGGATENSEARRHGLHATAPRARAVVDQKVTVTGVEMSKRPLGAEALTTTACV